MRESRPPPAAKANAESVATSKYGKLVDGCGTLAPQSTRYPSSDLYHPTNTAHPLLLSSQRAYEVASGALYIIQLVCGPRDCLRCALVACSGMTLVSRPTDNSDSGVRLGLNGRFSAYQVTPLQLASSPV